ncbi:quinone oxidoreductase family protein [Ornithinibacillus bavariensis]|uniref:Quinone oxidoreductase n=1 Tax=Ornithinibacillus bavariensis TaxID=545502 RepID=A0A920C5X5_9BACI|nr:zinc-binding dehydrogenase [Ornithinibacillus bavariensis]GIO25524.1 quinone oxidoreductase [Ornithinibacillus bavariensis]
MKAVVLEAFGGPEVLQYLEIPMPEPNAGEVLIKTWKTSVNFADIKNRNGKKSKGNFPLILGIDLVGIVEKVGPDVKNIKKGQRVIAFPHSGSYAEFAIANEQLVFPIPDNMDTDIAAASPIVSFLSYMLFQNVGRISKGETVLVHSAAGGVGTTAIQIAKLLGASKVIGTVGSEARKKTAFEAGADEVFTYEDFTSNVLDVTNGNGVDLILDSVSGKVTEKSMDCLAEYGRLVHFGNSSGELGTFKTNEIHSSCRSVLGFSLGNTRKKRPYLLNEVADQVIRFLVSGELHIIIGDEFPLHKVAEAHRLIENRQHSGKILLNVRG